MPELWLPGWAGPHEEFVTRLHRQIDAFGEERRVAKPIVQLELRDGRTFKLERISPDPGFGFVTVTPFAEEDDEDLPEALIVPVGSIAGIELRSSEEPEPRFGFSSPEVASPERDMPARTT